MTRELSSRSTHTVVISAAILVVAVIAVVGYSVVYTHKVYPGVSVDGIYIGGLDRVAATKAIQTQAAAYAGEQLKLQSGSGTVTVPVRSLGVEYSQRGLAAALDYGRRGSLAQQVRTRVRSLLGRSASFSDFTYNDAALVPTIAAIDATVTQPVANAALAFSNGQVTVTASRPGTRLDTADLVEAVNAQLAVMGDHAIRVPVYTLAPSITETSLDTVRGQASAYVASPLKVTAGPVTQTVSQSQILSWVDVKSITAQTDLPLKPLQSFYPFVQGPNVGLSLNQTKVGSYAASMSAGLNHPAQDAVLGWQNNALTVLQASKPGVAFDQDKATQQIVAAVTNPNATHDVTIPSSVTQATVNENNLASLGISQQLSEGVTYFPGSSVDRIVNVTVGAHQFNDVLLAPGEQFSFGKILGPVGAAQGYRPGLVILGNHEEDQYGGGLCQVASTAFRAALLAGLPINQRSNHSYAVSFYTAPYGVPGVDATIYYPQVDLKFTNDTGHYLLIQTSISGTTLKFDYYGTKTKQGVIRGPSFVSGNSDATKASHTVFYRDVEDTSGNVIKTDTFNQYYQPSTNFPIEQTSTGA